jgi:hypothetical protein
MLRHPRVLTEQVGFHPTCGVEPGNDGRGSVRSRARSAARPCPARRYADFMLAGAECAQRSSRNTGSNCIARFKRHAARSGCSACRIGCGADPFGPLSSRPSPLVVPKRCRDRSDRLRVHVRWRIVVAPGTSITLQPRHCEALRSTGFLCGSFLPRHQAAQRRCEVRVWFCHTTIRHRRV